MPPGKSGSTFLCLRNAGLSGGREDYERFCTLYLDRFYPLRLMLRANGVAFPDSPRG